MTDANRVTLRPRVYDSHCHIDLLEVQRITIDDWAHLLSSTDGEFEFGGSIPNFCYPSVYLNPLGGKASCDVAKKSGGGHNPQLANLDLGLLAKRVNLMPADWILGATFGVHPKNATEYTDEVHDFLWKICTDCFAYGFRPIAIGECGADESNENVPSRQVQLEALGRQLDVAKHFALPVVIHLRPDARSSQTDLEEEVFGMMCKKLTYDHHVHFHCFSLSKSIADKWQAWFPNCYFGFTPKIVGRRCSTSLLKVAKECPIDRVLLETDAPFFGVNSSTGYPANALDVAKKLATLRKMSIEEVLLQTEKNTRAVYKLPNRA